MKNSLLDKKIYSDTLKKYRNVNNSENEDILQYLGESFVSMAVGGGIGVIPGTIIGGIICPYWIIGMIYGGAFTSFIGMLGALVGYDIYYNYSPDNKSLSGKYKSNPSKEKYNTNNEQIKEEMQKFVYFKDNKIVGFIKFKNNITPPVNGYYFKCDYNLKLDIKTSQFIQDISKNVLKNEIDFYDGNEYIQNMKKLLNVNNIMQGIS